MKFDSIKEELEIKYPKSSIQFKDDMFYVIPNIYYCVRTNINKEEDTITFIGPYYKCTIQLDVCRTPDVIESIINEVVKSNTKKVTIVNISGDFALYSYDICQGVLKYLYQDLQISKECYISSMKKMGRKPII